MIDSLRRRSMTVAELRAVLDSVPGDAVLLVGIRDRHHFNSLLGDMPVVGATVMPSGSGHAVVLDVATIS